MIVSLTTFPARAHRVWQAIESIRRQSVPPAAVVLVLAEPEFPGHRLPATLQSRVDSGAVEILWTPTNSRGCKKLVPTLRTFPDAVIVTADDDLMYPRHWLRSLMSAHEGHPHSIVARRAHEVGIVSQTVAPYSTWRPATIHTPSHLVFPTNGAGTLFPPNVLDPTVLDEDLAMTLCPYADDVWFRAMSWLTHADVRYLGTRSQLAAIGGMQDSALHHFNLRQQGSTGNGNDEQLRAVLNFFGLWDVLGTARP